MAVRHLLWVAVILVLSQNVSAVTLDELRGQLESQSVDSLTATHALSLADQAIVVAESAESRSDFWNAMTFIAEICQIAPAQSARIIRQRALATLSAHFSDTMRWSSLISDRFMPAFASRETWRAELNVYDSVLEDLARSSDDERVRAELVYARIYVRSFINRQWDWLTAEDRQQALSLIDFVTSKFGQLPAPGNPDMTVAERLQINRYELEHLYFGAVAPATSGVDLNGNPISIADYRGEIVVLDFWTSFCLPCLALVPSVNTMLSELDGEPVVYLGINGDPDRSQGLATAQRVGMTWRNLWDSPDGPSGPAAQAWAVTGWPSVFVLDASGRIRCKLTGKERIERELKPAIEQLLREHGDE